MIRLLSGMLGVGAPVLYEGETGVALVVANITTFLTQALVWMGNILSWVLGEPLILFFLAIGLAGVMFRWAKRMIHI